MMIVTALVLPAIGGQGGMHVHGHSAGHKHHTQPAQMTMPEHQVPAMMAATAQDTQDDCCQTDCQCAQHSCHFSLIASQFIKTSFMLWPQDKPVSIAGRLHHAFREQPYRPPIA